MVAIGCSIVGSESVRGGWWLRGPTAPYKDADVWILEYGKSRTGHNQGRNNAELQQTRATSLEMKPLIPPLCPNGALSSSSLALGLSRLTYRYRRLQLVQRKAQDDLKLECIKLKQWWIALRDR